ncbi:MAG: TetR family transcriptional regulator [Candidatus Cloacimonetes bacterium HGW-Cloacimonetes-2]|nr:MAG: TetR family transcriptional regulator [Candidatus Cloacimonetes bacterium HGW-Cloacimonetes-2]
MNLTKRQMELVESAIRIIAEQGLDKLTTKNLASAIGVTEAALYRHFKSKNDLMRMILSYFEKLSCQVLDDIRTGGLDPVESVRRFVLDRYKLFSGKPALAKVMFSEEIFTSTPAFTDHYQMIMHKHKSEVVAYILRGQSEQLIRQNMDANQIFRIVVGSMRFIVMQWNLSRQVFDLEAEGTALLDTIIELIEVKQ